MKITFPKAAACVALAAIIFATVSPISMRPADLLPVNVDRALAFGVLFTLLGFAYRRHWKLVVFAALCGPGLIELLQLLSPTRHAQLADAVVKSVGALGGVFCGTLIGLLHKGVVSRRQQASGRSASRGFGANPAFRNLPVSSGLIESIYFSPEDGKLRICMKDGDKVLFEGVTENEATAIATAPSPGQYYLTEFKPRYKRAA